MNYRHNGLDFRERFMQGLIDVSPNINTNDHKLPRRHILRDFFFKNDITFYKSTNKN